jgi:hypothetical protein
MAVARHDTSNGTHVSINDMTSDGQVTFKKLRSYFNSVTWKRNSPFIIRYPLFIVTVPLLLLVTDVLNVTKWLLVSEKSNYVRSGTVTPLVLRSQRDVIVIK